MTPRADATLDLEFMLERVKILGETVFYMWDRCEFWEGAECELYWVK